LEDFIFVQGHLLNIHQFQRKWKKLWKE
jgi:hypothetical protein